MVQATTYGNPSSGEEFEEVAATLSDSESIEDASQWNGRSGSESVSRIARSLTSSAGPLPASSTLEDCQKALYEAQLTIGTLRSDVRRAKLENTPLPTSAGSERRSGRDRHGTPLDQESASVGPSSSISTSSESKSNVALSQSDKVISMLGKKFGVMNNTFVSAASFLKACPPAASDLSVEDGIIFELYAAVPPGYHRMMRTAPHFYQTFLKGLMTNRRTLIHQLRNETATIIFGRNASYYKPDFDRSAIPEFTDLLKFPQDRDKVGYSKFMPILFPSEKKDLRQLFRSYPLALMLKSILFGPSSLGAGKYSGPKPQGVVWGVNFVTPGSIAFVAILAIFLHSADSTFSATGAKSKIPYQKYFTQYKRIIVEGEGTSKIAKLYEFFNGILFGASASTDKADTNLSDEDSSGIEDALNDLRMSNAEDGVLADPVFNTTTLPSITIQPQVESGTALSTEAMEQVIDTDGNLPVLSPLMPAALTTIPETPQIVSSIRSTDPTAEIPNQAPKSRKKGKEKASNLPTESSQSSTQPRVTRRSTRKVM